jgi:hypothetical protein
VSEKDEYREVYAQELKKCTDKQVINLLILNTRNQATKSKKYGMSKRQTEHVAKIAVNIELIEAELLERLEKK